MSTSERALSPAPFVVGVNRSGTTLLRLMLDAHPDLAIPPETHFVPELIETFGAGPAEPGRMAAAIAAGREWSDFGFSEDELAAAISAEAATGAAGAVRAFFRLYAHRAGKPRWGDKTPAYGRSMTAIAGTLPEARFVHVIRDGRDVLLSIREHSDRRRPAERVAERWRSRVVDAREQARSLPHYREVRFERLVSDPEPVLREICELIALPWSPAMLAHHRGAATRMEEMRRELPPSAERQALGVERRMATHARAVEAPDPTRAERWRRDLSDEDRRRFESVAGELLQELGYETGEPTE